MSTEKLRLEPCTILDDLYAFSMSQRDYKEARETGAPTAVQTDVLTNLIDSDAVKDRLLLQPSSGKQFADKLCLPAIEIEIERAAEQVQRKIESFHL